MPDPAKLEFLTRTPDQPGFQVRAIPSTQVHVLFKPKRLPSSEWEITPQPRSPDGSQNFTLRSLSKDRYILLTPREKFLWEQFDGDHSLSEIGRAFHFQFGSFDYGTIRGFLAQLYYMGLLEEVAVSTGFQRAARDRKAGRWLRHISSIRKAWAYLSFKLSNADHYCTVLYRRGGFLLFNRTVFWLVVALTAVAAVAVAALAPQTREISMRVTDRPILSAALIIALLPVVSVLHVLVHALACKSYGRKVREIGFFLLQGVLPTFYADVTDIFMSTRRARVIVDLAGPMVEVALGSFAFIAAYCWPPGLGQSLFFAAGILLWEGALINLYPFSFLELDGYNILADLLAMPTLRRQALALAPDLPRRVRQRRALHRSHWIQLGYLSLCFVSVVVYLIAHFGVVAKKFLNIF
jgi:hypothetical protein